MLVLSKCYNVFASSSLSGDENRASQISNLSNGQVLLQDFLNNMSQQKESMSQQMYVYMHNIKLLRLFRITE